MKQDILFAVIVGAVVVGGIVYIGPAAALGEVRGFVGIDRQRAEYVFGPDYVAPEPGKPPVNPLSYPVTPEPESVAGPPEPVTPDEFPSGCPMNFCSATPEPTPPPITDLSPAREAELVAQCEVKTRELLPPPGEVAEDFIWGGKVVLVGGFLFWDGKDFSAVCRFVEGYRLYWCDFNTRQDGGSCRLRATGMEVKTSPCVVMKITLHV